MRNLDDSAVWEEAVRMAVGRGILHANMCQKASSARWLFRNISLAMGGICGRRFHQDELRRAYGAAYNGIAKVREAKAKGF